MSKPFNRSRVLNSGVCIVLAALLLAGCSSKEERAQSLLFARNAAHLGAR